MHHVIEIEPASDCIKSICLISYRLVGQRKRNFQLVSQDGPVYFREQMRLNKKLLYGSNHCQTCSIKGTASISRYTYFTLKPHFYTVFHLVIYLNPIELILRHHCHLFSPTLAGVSPNAMSGEGGKTCAQITLETKRPSETGKARRSKTVFETQLINA